MRFGVVFLEIVLVGIVWAQSQDTGPVCSRFDYDVKTLERVLKLELAMETFSGKIRAWDSEVKKKMETLNLLEENITEGFKQLSGKINRELARSTNATSKLSSKLRRSIRRSLGRFNVTIRWQGAKMGMLRDEMNWALNEVIKPATTGNHTAFSVHTPTGKVVDSVPIFKEEVTNLGDGYNNYTGVFTCPWSGLYHFDFSVTAASSSSNSVGCNIRHNNQNVTYASSDQNVADSSSVTVNLLLDKEDRVNLVCYNWEHVSQTPMTSFSGAFINSKFNY